MKLKARSKYKTMSQEERRIKLSMAIKNMKKEKWPKSIIKKYQKQLEDLRK